MEDTTYDDTTYDETKSELDDTTYNETKYELDIKTILRDTQHKASDTGGGTAGCNYQRMVWKPTNNIQDPAPTGSGAASSGAASSSTSKYNKMPQAAESQTADKQAAGEIQFDDANDRKMYWCQ